MITTWWNCFAEIVNGFQSLIIFIKSSILDVSLGSGYASEFAHPYKTFPKYLKKIYSWKTNYIKMKNILWTHKIDKTDKNTEKMFSKVEWVLISYFLVSTHQAILLNIGCFWQYFVSMSVVLHVNLISFFICSSISSIINLSGTFSMAILCQCYMLNFWFYVQFDQFDEGRQNVIIPCII